MNAYRHNKFQTYLNRSYGRINRHLIIGEYAPVKFSFKNIKTFCETNLPYSTNERGFIIVVALLVLLLLTAVGALVFNLTTQDIRVSTRAIGEKKAFSAAQAGIHRLVDYSNANAGSIGNYLVSVPTQVDPGADPATKFTIGNANIPGIPASLPMAGFEITQLKSWGQTVTPKSVTGINEKYESSVTIDVGIGYGPIEISTQQPAAGG